MAQPNLYANHGKPLNIIIVGGSCAGLFAGILLKRQGHNVHILESAISSEREGLAAGVGLAAHVRKFFNENDRLKNIPFGTAIATLDVTDWDFNVKTKITTQLRMTTWDAMYYRLRANFDSFQSPYCKAPPPLEASEGSGVFDTGELVLGVNETKDGIEVVTENATTSKLKVYDADIVIAADGCNSSIRRQLVPDLKREERGYVLWRGTVPTKQLSKQCLDRVDGRTTLYQMQYSYAIIYPVPGVHGSLEDGEREINWGWYFWVTQSELGEILTDKSGHQHRTTLPKGGMRPEIWQRQLDHARRMFHPDIFEFIEKIENPFVSIVSTISSPRAAFHNNRLFIIGDALSQKQPNTAQGVNMAALDAMTLVDMIGGKMGPQQWNDETVERAEIEKLRSVAFASYYLNGWIGFVLAQMRYRWLLWRKGWVGLWKSTMFPVFKPKR